MSSAKANILSRLTRENSTIKNASGPPTLLEQPKSKKWVTAELIERLKNNAAHVIQCSEETLTPEIEGFFTSNNLEKQLLTNLHIKDLAEKVKLKTGFAKGDELVGLSLAECGISDTGTLVLRSSPENPTSVNFLVDWHLVILKESTIVANLNQALMTLKQNDLTNCRAINLISGPSRTADIEQTIQLGAHGPRHLCVFILREG